MGFKGLFGLDFIIDSKGNILIVDLNPRRQGGYLCNILMSKKVNIPEMELKLALGESIPAFDYEDFQVDYSWIHSKITPYYRETTIISPFILGNPHIPFEQIGTKYECIFYPSKYLLIGGNGGYFIMSGHNKEELKSFAIKEVEEILSKRFKLYSSF